MDEYNLWKEWFATDGGLYEFLEAMCEPLYDHLRPRIIHETQLPKLCELCTLIHTRYMEDEEEEEYLTDVLHLDFGHVIQPALEDAQTRLVFLAMAVLRAEIQYYKPRPEDLNYPRMNRGAPLSGGRSNGPVLSGTRGRKAPANGLPKAPTVVDEEGMDSQFNLEPSLQDCYPTLRKAIWLLSRIYRLVNVSFHSDEQYTIVADAFTVCRL